MVEMEIERRRRRPAERVGRGRSSDPEAAGASMGIEVEAAPAKRLERGEVVVGRVLDAAIEEIALVGYAALTLERVAARAGVNRTTIYRRWPTKAALSLAAMERVAGTISFAIDTGSMREDLRVLVETASRTIFAPGALVISRLTRDAGEPEIVELAARLRAEKAVQALAMIERWQRRGELKTDLAHDLFFESIMGLLYLRSIFQPEPMTPAVVERIVDHFCATAGASPPAAKPRRHKPRGRKTVSKKKRLR